MCSWCLTSCRMHSPHRSPCGPAQWSGSCSVPSWCGRFPSPGQSQPYLVWKVPLSWPITFLAKAPCTGICTPLVRRREGGWSEMMETQYENSFKKIYLSQFYPPAEYKTFIWAPRCAQKVKTSNLILAQKEEENGNLICVFVLAI